MKSLTRFAWQFAASPRQALRAHCDGLPPSLRVCTATVLLVFGLTALLLFTASCAHTMQGLSREQALYRAGTNVVGQAQSLAPYLPAPVGNTVEIFLKRVKPLLSLNRSRTLPPGPTTAFSTALPVRYT
jgi:hypothetical protein